MMERTPIGDDLNPVLESPSGLETIASMLNETGSDFPSLVGSDLERMERAQGPITELYACLLTLFLNPACWNRFENNQLRYLQYLYLRRRLRLLEEARLKGMKNGTEAKGGKDHTGMSPSMSEKDDDGSAQPEPSPYTKILMRYTPRLAQKLGYVQKKLKSFQKVVGAQVAQARGLAKQTFAATAAQVQALLPVVQQRIMVVAGQARALMEQTIAAITSPPAPAHAPAMA